MHKAAGTDDLAAINLSDALVSEADAENRDSAAEVHNRIAADPCFGRSARAGRDANLFRSERLDFPDSDFVIAFDEKFGAEFAEVLDEVVGERVVVIDDENHILALSMARIPAIALFTVSWYSPSGVESVTTPPPDWT